MRFAMPNFPCDFELPDEWLLEAGISGFKPSGPAYTAPGDCALVAIAEIEPPYRLPTHPKHWRGFDRERLLRVLKGFVAGAPIEPVPLLELPEQDVHVRPYRYRVLDGYHRFYASIAAGFSALPVVIR